MTTFEVESVTILHRLSDHPREEAKRAVQKYRAKKSEVPYVPDVPPSSSIRRVFYAASTGAKRTLWQRIKQLFIGDMELF